MRKVIEVRKKIAFFLYFIASTDRYQFLANLFGVSRAFVSIRIREVEDAFLIIHLPQPLMTFGWFPN